MIADRAAAGDRDLAELAAQAVEGGADVIQYRDKSATDAQKLQQALRIRKAIGGRAPLIINDSIRVALDSGADGVHLGQDDASLDEARRALGEAALIGRSTHSPAQGRSAQSEGFDYIGVGPVYATPTKPDYRPAGLTYVRFAASELDVPFVAIGGIDASTLLPVLDAGARAVAVVRAVIGSPDPKRAAQNIRNILESKEST